MPLPSAWLDHLFGRLSVRYGSAFTRQWPDVEIAAVKADWGEVLDGTSGAAISYALRYLPIAPCNAMQFRDLCRRAPSTAPLALTDDGARADPARVQEVLAGLSLEGGAGSPAQRCADSILSIAQANGRLSAAQRDQIRAMWGRMTPQQRDRAAEFTPRMGGAA
ncbi:MAG: hypothetical protein RJA55_1442 [Acidobacteriota bacterium]|jgi:hypothetical protein